MQSGHDRLVTAAVSTQITHVVEAIGFAAKHNLELAVKGGGYAMVDCQQQFGRC